MKKMFIMVALLAGLSMPAFAQDVMEVAEKVTVELQNAGVITAEEASVVKSSVETLIQCGNTAEEAKAFVEQVVLQAKVQGLTGEAFAANLQKATDERKAELTKGAVTPVEHPTMPKTVMPAKPKDHPAH